MTDPKLKPCPFCGRPPIDVEALQREPDDPIHDVPQVTNYEGDGRADLKRMLYLEARNFELKRELEILKSSE